MQPEAGGAARRRRPLRSLSYRKWLQNSFGPGAGDWLVELMEDGGAAAGSSWMASKKTQAAHFKLEGRRVDCVRAGPEYSRRRARAGWGQGAATTRMAAGWEPGRLGRRAGAGRPPRRGTPNISSLTRAGRWRGSRAAEEQVGRSCSGRVRGGVRGLTTWAGNARPGKPARQEEVLDRSRTHFLRLE